MPPSLFAGVCVRDHAAALPWYEQLLGPPAFHPHATETVWELAEARFLYIVEEADHAGHARVFAMLDDLDATLAEVAARGLELTRMETHGDGVRKAVFADADGNEIGFGGMPQSD